MEFVMAADGNETAPAAKTPGAKRAGAGDYYFDMGTVTSIMGGPQYSSVFGPCIEAIG